MEDPFHNLPMWEEGQCEGCKKHKKIHIATGQCEGCMVNAPEEE